jgi:hypothetical protein
MNSSCAGLHRSFRLGTHRRKQPSRLVGEGSKALHRLTWLTYFFAGSRTLTRSVPTTMSPVKPPSAAAFL